MYLRSHEYQILGQINSVNVAFVKMSQRDVVKTVVKLTLQFKNYLFI